MRIYPFFVFLICLLSVSILNGQDNITIASQTKGFSGGVRLGYLSYTNDDVHPFTEGGIGYGAQLQYGFSHPISIAFSYQHFGVTSRTDNNTLSPYPYDEFDLIGKYIFGSTASQWRPYLSLGLNYTRTKESFYYANVNVETLEKYSGSSFCVGGGVSYFINSKWSLDLAGLFHTGAFTTILIDGDQLDESFSFSSFTGLVGIFYHF
jgi:opacity protein-like surface antigen